MNDYLQLWKPISVHCKRCGCNDRTHLGRADRERVPIGLLLTTFAKLSTPAPTQFPGRCLHRIDQGDTRALQFHHLLATLALGRSAYGGH